MRLRGYLVWHQPVVAHNGKRPFGSVRGKQSLPSLDVVQAVRLYRTRMHWKSCITEMIRRGSIESPTHYFP